MKLASKWFPWLLITGSFQKEVIRAIAESVEIKVTMTNHCKKARDIQHGQYRCKRVSRFVRIKKRHVAYLPID